MKKRKIEDPSFKIFPTKIDPVGGRKGEQGIDDIRPSGPSYSESIAAHQAFCEGLGNGTLNPNEKQAGKEAQRKYTESRLAGRNGRGERP